MHMATKCYLVLVSCAWGGKKLEHTLRRLEQSGEVRVVAFSAQANGELANLGIEAAGVEAYADRPDEFDLSRKAIAELNDYPRRPAGGVPLGEWLKYDNLPLWPFVSPNLFADVNTQAKTLAIINKIIEREGPDCLVCLDAEALPFLWHYLRGLAKEPLLIDRLARIVAKREGIEWQPVKPSLKLRAKHFLTNLFGRVFSALYGGVWLMLGAAVLRKTMARIANWLYRFRTPCAGGEVVLFSHKKYWRREFNPLRGDVAPTDTAVYSVAKALIDAGDNVHCIDGNYGFVGGLGPLWQKLSGEQRPQWSTFDQWYPLAKLWSACKGVRNARKVFEHKRDLEDIFSYAGFDTGYLFLPRLHFLLHDYLWKSALWIEAGREFVRQTRPGLVALTYETGTLSRAIISACKEEGVPTIGMQHGAFSDATDDYVRTPLTHAHCYVPDKTAVWGERFRQVLLEKSAYREGEIVVTGNPRMDFLVEAQSLLATRQLYQKYGLDPERNIAIAAPTETIGRSQHMAKDRFFDGIVAAARANPDTQWVIKLKPGAENQEYYRRRLPDIGDVELVLTEDDLYPLLVVSAVVVTPPSSVAIEALLMRKPVIYVVFSDAEDYFPHLSAQGAVRTVHKMDNLHLEVERLCREAPHGLLTESKLTDLVFEENYKPDGRAAKRIAELIQNVRRRSPATATNQQIEEIEIERTSC